MARRFGPVVLEDLKIANMTASVRGCVGKSGRKARQKAGLTSRILAQGRNRFAKQILRQDAGTWQSRGDVGPYLHLADENVERCRYQERQKPNDLPLCCLRTPRP